jgi:hypothetical protein
VEEVRGFVKAFAPEFKMHARPADGSHPLRWSELHAHFKQCFEAQLEAVLAREMILREELVEYAAELREVACSLPGDAVIPASGGLKAKGFCTFLDNFTAAEDYEAFLEVMFAAASQLTYDVSSEVVPAYSLGQPDYLVSATQMAALPLRASVGLDVIVPDGALVEESLLGEHGGYQYQSPVAAGYPIHG